MVYESENPSHISSHVSSDDPAHDPFENGLRRYEVRLSNPLVDHFLKSEPK